VIRSFFTGNQETNHFLMFLFSDRATPLGYQHGEIISINTYRFTKPVRIQPYSKDSWSWLT
jgi:catalase